jgi:mono/diheme cytochrome c family protein
VPWRSVTTGCVLTLVAAIGWTEPLEKPAPRGPAAHEQGLEIPATESGRPNPVASSVEALRVGHGLWTKHCETCHGAKGKGDGSNARLHEARRGYAPRDLTDPQVQENLTDGDIQWRIAKGILEGHVIVMPAFEEKIPVATQRWTLALFVRELGRVPTLRPIRQPPR